jgi:hypothetical protein
MNRLIALLAAGSMLAAPGAALAKHSPKSKVYKGSFEYVGADGDYVTGKFGKVHLVDGKRNDKLSVHVRRLAAKTTYVYRLQSASSACSADAPGGTDVPGWTYRKLKTSRSGVANATARSRTFTVNKTRRYFVGVFRAGPNGAPGELVLCAKLNKPRDPQKPGKHGKPGQPAKPGKHGKPAKPGKHGQPGKPAEPAKPKPAEPGAPARPSEPAEPDKPRGKRDDAPHGKSDDAPRGNANGHDKRKPSR